MATIDLLRFILVAINKRDIATCHDLWTNHMKVKASYMFMCTSNTRIWIIIMIIFVTWTFSQMISVFDIEFCNKILRFILTDYHFITYERVFDWINWIQRPVLWFDSQFRYIPEIERKMNYYFFLFRKSLREKITRVGCRSKWHFLNLIAKSSFLLFPY